jgi:hypothetical protein
VTAGGRSWIIALGLGLATMVSPAPAFAHSGGRAQLYVATANVAPQGQGWAVTAVLRDLDSGALEPGFAVEVSGRGPSGAAFGPVALADPEGDGRYDAPVPGVTEGNWLVTLRANEVPGGRFAVPLARSWNVTLQPGQPVDLVRGGSSSGGRSSGTNAVPWVEAIGGLVAVTLFIAARRGRHRRTMAPAP